jgi:predicted alpha-1,2-mannosidase
MDKTFASLLWKPFWLLLIVALLSAAKCDAAQRDDTGHNLASLVNPYIGTVMSFTFPGATLPNGMVQLSPDMPRSEILRGGGAPGASYLYTKKCQFINGFSMTHLSGTGCWNYGDVFFTATTGPVQTSAKKFRFRFSHRQEAATPGYYRVFMKTWGINAQFSATLRCGVAKFTFPAGKQANILVPISHVMGHYGSVPHTCYLHFVDDHTIVGFVTSHVFCTAWPPVRVYFVMQVDQPWKTSGLWKSGKFLPGGLAAEKSKHHPVGAYMTYPASNVGREIKLRIGISYVSIKGAEGNLATEVPNWSFSGVRKAARARWNRALSVIRVRGGTLSHRVCFYTALYHALLDPTVFDDSDGNYIGYDNKLHHVPAGHRHIYANFSGWDIYRTEIPLLCLIDPQRVQDMAQSIVEMYKQAGFIPSWPAANRAGNGMTGDPLTICLAHIWESGLHNFDIKAGYQGMLADAQSSHKMAFTTINRVATDEECDISYEALSRLAFSLGHFKHAVRLAAWAEQYREMFNPATGFMQPRLPDGAWMPNFNPALYDQVHYMEGTAWEYLWLVPQDVQGLIALLGGDKAFSAKLTEFFNGHHYDPTNEPDIEAPFLYDYACAPWKTQRIAAYEGNKRYTDKPGGLAWGGQDDLGTMSAWYVLSQMGIYAVDPGRPDLEVCTPRFRKITIQLKVPYNGKRFTIEAPKAGGANIYIQSAVLNGKPLTKPWFPETMITGGGVWKVVVGPQPNKAWGAATRDVPPSMSNAGADK